MEERKKKAPQNRAFISYGSAGNIHQAVMHRAVFLSCLGKGQLNVLGKVESSWAQRKGMESLCFSEPF